MTERPIPGEFMAYYQKYVDLAPAETCLATLEISWEHAKKFFAQLSDADGDTAYAAGKWTVKQMLLHLADAERIFLYRALRFARKDTRELSGFDENSYAAAAEVSHRTLTDLFAEWQTTRQASIAFFGGLDPVALTRRGSANGGLSSVRALAFIIAGHGEHHISVLIARYGFGAV